MNEQPQPNNLQPGQGAQHESNQPLYKPEGTPASSFSGFDLAHGAQATPPAPASPVAPEAPTIPPAPVAPAHHTSLNWEASEYIHHTKSAQWFAGYVAIMLVLLAVAYFFTHAWTFIILVVVMAIAIGVFATRPPRTLRYALNDSGLQIENSSYHYSDFRAFGIINDGALYSIMLIPVKRFMPAVNIYFAEQDGEKIVDILGSRLPMEELHLDAIDLLMRRLRF